MQVVILAGGRGTRLRPLTNKIPKSMIPINNKPFLEHQIELLKKFNLTELILCIGYLADEIKSYFGNGSRCRVNIIYSTEEYPMDTGGALKKAEKYLTSDFVVLNGDTYLPIDYLNFISHFNQINKVGLMVVCDNSDKIAFNNIALDEASLVTDYSKEEEKSNMGYVDAGAIIFKKEILNSIAANKVISLEKEIYPNLIKKRELGAYITHHLYYDIGTPQGLNLIRGVLSE